MTTLDTWNHLLKAFLYVIMQLQHIIKKGVRIQYKACVLAFEIKGSQTSYKCFDK